MRYEHRYQIQIFGGLSASKDDVFSRKSFSLVKFWIMFKENLIKIPKHVRIGTLVKKYERKFDNLEIFQNHAEQRCERTSFSENH